MQTFVDSQEKMKETAEKCLDSQLWHACAGSMVQMLPVNSKVFYFPQGHAEHACGTVDFRACPRLPPYIPCRVSGVKFMADPESDEVFAKIQLTPYSGNEVIDFDDGGGGGVVSGLNGTDNQEKPASFAKTLTQSDANNGGGFSVPRYCAETIFPRLDYNADPPVQNILAKDVHGETWKFRHIYRGTPRRHLLTTGWSTFVNHKKLIAGDSIVFLRAENGDLCVGIRRAKRGIGGGPDSSSSGWNTSAGNSIIPYGGLSAFLREDEGKLMRNGNGGSSSLMGRGRVKAESVVEAATLAANGRPFEVIYYPRASTPEFCVKASLVKSALRLRWCSGMRFKMPFETEDSSRISWFMGTISSVQVADPILWPDSPWRLLQVTWDEPDLLQNVKRVSPWLVELVSNMPTIHLSPFSPPRKKLRLPQHPEFPLDGQISLPTFTGNHLFGSNSPFGCLGDNIPAGMQGARHAQYGLSLSDIQFNKLQSGLFPVGLHHFDRSAIPRIHHNNNNNNNSSSSSGNISCLLSMGSPAQPSKKFASENGKKATTAQFVLFGQPILTEQQISLSNGSACVLDDVVSPVRTGNNSSDGNNLDKLGNTSDGSGSAPPPTNVRGIDEQRLSCDDGFESNLETGHCKVFMESEDVGRTLDLSLLRSYEELYGKLATMFNIGSSDILNHVLYRDSTGCVRQLGLEPFSDFTRTARRLTIQTDSSSDNIGT